MRKNRRQRRQEAAQSAPTSSIDPFKIYMNAERFRIADQVLRQDAVLQQHGHSIGAPIVMMAAFASELYLKCLFTIETSRPPIESHELRKLFLQLSQSARDEIEQLWDAYNAEPKRVLHYEALERFFASPIPRDLRWSLRSGNDAFVALRYLHEDRNSQTKFLLADFHHLVRTVILRRHPQWAAIVHAPAQDIG